MNSNVYALLHRTIDITYLPTGTFSLFRGHPVPPLPQSLAPHQKNTPTTPPLDPSVLLSSLRLSPPLHYPTIISSHSSLPPTSPPRQKAEDEAADKACEREPDERGIGLRFPAAAGAVDALSDSAIAFSSTVDDVVVGKSPTVIIWFITGAGFRPD